MRFAGIGPVKLLFCKNLQQNGGGGGGGGGGRAH